MPHLDGVLFRVVVVDEHGRGVEGRGLQDLLLKGAVPPLQQRHPVEGPGGHQEAGSRVAALAPEL